MRVSRDLRSEIGVGIAVLILGGAAFVIRGSLMKRAATDADARLAALEPQVAELDRAASEVAALRSSVVPRAQLEKELGELHPLFFSNAAAALGRVREVCRQFAAPSSFEPERDVHALPPFELTTGSGPRRSRMPIEVVLTASWEKLAPFLAELRGSKELVLVEYASVERSELPNVCVHLVLETLLGDGGAP